MKQGDTDLQREGEGWCRRSCKSSSDEKRCKGARYGDCGSGKWRCFIEYVGEEHWLMFLPVESDNEMGGARISRFYTSSSSPWVGFIYLHAQLKP
ncbi:hypothetical protein L6452_28518 [Arctium lappa]|uniref:Uncharacterized protein n=1 Tax=Arctium lappa TaxID=4217 RepID=A0ACB8ZZ57_ARCLA|nr:hypothetical protein L6452_28518 [Arctium lappa]